MTKSQAGVLFDIDGTLCDTNYLHVVAWTRALRDLGEEVDGASIHRCIGMGSDLLLQAVIGRDDEHAHELHAKHFEAFHDDIRTFPKARDLLEKVAEMGLRVVLASSASEDDYNRLVDVIDADHVIHTGTQSGDVETAKPEPDIFMAAVQKGDLDPQKTIVVGDTVWDMKAARKAGLSCIAVLTGGIDEHALRKAGAGEVYKDAADLLEHIQASAIGKLTSR